MISNNIFKSLKLIYFMDNTFKYIKFINLFSLESNSKKKDLEVNFNTFIVFTSWLYTELIL